MSISRKQKKGMVSSLSPLLCFLHQPLTINLVQCDGKWFTCSPFYSVQKLSKPHNDSVQHYCRQPSSFHEGACSIRSQDKPTDHKSVNKFKETNVWMMSNICDKRIKPFSLSIHHQPVHTRTNRTTLNSNKFNTACPKQTSHPSETEKRTTGQWTICL